ncbi:DUF7288 family protein [Halomarina ordinaria]|uniref:Type IV pilin n=1 Tax=Halomarina ordinaria TaxID=3033939 RepID=A0ABD5UBK3_9EURY|nr:hypothetical protein [Halomarina sp. PSRA2]
MVSDDRGQVHTLEAIVAGVILVTGLVYALQVTAVTPLSASTSSQHIENQQAAVSEGVLAASMDDGSLEETLRSWDEDEERFHGADGREFFVNDRPDNAFGDRLGDTFEERGTAVNVVVRYEENDGTETQNVVYRGNPSDNAVTTTQTLTLFDGDHLYGADGEPTETRLDETDTFYVPDDTSDSMAYAVVTVEVTTWRM